jgi:uncharacterized protein
MTTSSLGKFVWFEYVSTAAKKAQAFYGEVLGWRVQDVPMGPTPYQMIAVGDKTVGGYAEPAVAGTPPHWISHLRVASAADTVAAVKRAGGKVLQDATKVGDYGTMARIADPLGGALCLWQPAKPDDDAAAPANGHFLWNELCTQDVDKSLAFYRAIAGYETRSMNMGEFGDYHLLSTGGEDRAGVMKAPDPNIPQVWLPYVQVASVDAAIDRTKRLGGGVAMPAADVPGVGRIGVITDSLGAQLGLMTPEPAPK